MFYDGMIRKVHTKEKCVSHDFVCVSHHIFIWITLHTCTAVSTGQLQSNSIIPTHPLFVLFELTFSPLKGKPPGQPPN